MGNSTEYIKHIDIVKDLNLYTTLRENQRPFEKKFEEIYMKAKNEDVKLYNAKEFLNSLSRDELRILQKFDSLSDSINVDILSDEGAYNLLVHNYEKYDFDNDGLVNIGLADQVASVPQHMNDEAKKVWLKTLNAMGDDFMAISVITLAFNDELIKRSIAEHLNTMSDSQIDNIQDSSTYDIRKFIDETLLQPYSPKLITLQGIIDKIDDVLYGEDGGQSSLEMLESTEHLKEELLNAYEEVK